MNYENISTIKQDKHILILLDLTAFLIHGSFDSPSIKSFANE